MLFRSYRADLGDGEITLPGADGPRIVLCTAGAAALRARDGGVEDRDLTIGRGESCFIAPEDCPVVAAGPAALFIAASGIDPAPLA